MFSKTNSPLKFIFITVLIDVIGLGIIIPIIPDLIRQLTGEGLSVASEYGGWLMFAYAIMQFIFAPILGNLSDQYGRRPIILISLLGLGVDYLFMAFAPTIFWLFIGRIIAGISGASFTAASAYIADISKPEERAQNFGLIGAAFGLGFIIGPTLGGLLGKYGVHIPFIFAAVLSLANAAYGYFILPESLPLDKRRKFSWKVANPLKSLVNLFSFKSLTGLIVAFIFIYLAAHAVQSTWSYYTMKKFAWDKTMVGVSLGIFGVLILFVQSFLIRYTIKWFGEFKSVYFGLFLYSLGLILMAFATNQWMLFVFLIPYCLGGIGGPALQSIISKQVPDNEQGALQGALTSLMSATSVIGPPMMTTLFAYTTKDDGSFYFPGSPFVLGAILMFISAVICFRTFKRRQIV